MSCLGCGSWKFRSWSYVVWGAGLCFFGALGIFFFGARVLGFWGSGHGFLGRGSQDFRARDKGGKRGGA